MSPPADPARAMRLVLPAGVGSVTPSHKAESESTPPTPSGPRKKGERIDWDAAEPMYRAGVLSDREIGKQLGCSHVAVAKHAREHGWDRDLNARAQAKADAKVTRAMVTKEVTNAKLVTNAVLVEALSDAIMRVKMEQRRDFARLRGLSAKLFEELEAQVNNREGLEGVIAESLFGDVISEATAKRLMEMLAFEGSVDALAKLTSVFSSLTEMERRAFKLDTAPDGDKGRLNLPIRFVDAPRLTHTPEDE